MRVFRANGKSHGEAGAAAGTVAGGGDLAVVELDDVPGDGQSQSEAAALVRAFGLTQSIEDVREECGIDPFAFVGDANAQRSVLALHAQVDVLTGRRELD